MERENVKKIQRQTVLTASDSHAYINLGHDNAILFWWSIWQEPLSWRRDSDLYIQGGSTRLELITISVHTHGAHLQLLAAMLSPPTTPRICEHKDLSRDLSDPSFPRYQLSSVIWFNWRESLIDRPSWNNCEMKIIKSGYLLENLKKNWVPIGKLKNRIQLSESAAFDKHVSIFLELLYTKAFQIKILCYSTLIKDTTENVRFWDTY